MKFLRAKHWQIFMVTYGIQIIVPAVVNAIPSLRPLSGKIQMLLMITLVINLFGWYWNICHTLQKYLDPSVRKSTVLFKVAFILPLVYLLFIRVYFLINGAVHFIEPSIGIPHVIALLSLLYVMGYAASIIKTAEKGSVISISECFGEICLIFFFPIGIWILQPRINRVVNRYMASRPTSSNG